MKSKSIVKLFFCTFLFFPCHLTYGQSNNDDTECGCKIKSGSEGICGYCSEFLRCEFHQNGKTGNIVSCSYICVNAACCYYQSTGKAHMHQNLKTNSQIDHKNNCIKIEEGSDSETPGYHRPIFINQCQKHRCDNKPVVLIITFLDFKHDKVKLEQGESWEADFKLPKGKLPRTTFSEQPSWKYDLMTPSTN